MNEHSPTIREVNENDDFDYLLELLNDTLSRHLKNTVCSIGISSDELKKQYADQKVYVAVCDGKIVAVADVRLTKMLKNGNLYFGYLEGYETALTALVEKCGSYVQSNQGHKLLTFARTKFGQVRNKEIALLESLGFVSDEYSYITCQLPLESWSAPDHLDTTDIEPIADMDTKEIYNLLLEDGEDEMAELFIRQFPPGQQRNRVVLCLRDQATGEIAGIAYYEVYVYRPTPEESNLQATAFGLHFRPEHVVNASDKKRLLQAALQSMKQLNVQHVMTKMTLNHFDVFAAMAAEGFTNDGLEELNSLRLTKSV